MFWVAWASFRPGSHATRFPWQQACCCTCAAFPRKCQDHIQGPGIHEETATSHCFVYLSLFQWSVPKSSIQEHKSLKRGFFSLSTHRCNMDQDNRTTIPACDLTLRGDFPPLARKCFYGQHSKTFSQSFRMLRH